MADNNIPPVQWHTFLCGGHQFTVPTRYQDPVSIGHGSFGAVIRAKDTETGKLVAIKKMLKPFESPTHAKRTYRELKLLTYLNHPDAAIVQLYNVFTPERTLNEFKTPYFVFNYAGASLNDVVKAKIPFLETHIRLIIYSMLRGLKFLHSAGIIHRDLKPPNISLDANSNITILDFGLARLTSGGIQTGYVATRWWRAPEIYVNWERYNEKLDIWSVGCIMAELISLRAIFRGTDHIDQLNKILDIIGTPSRDIVREICTGAIANYVIALPMRPKQDLHKLFGFKYNNPTGPPISGVSPEGVDLLDRLLSFDNRARPSAAEALEHPFFQTLHNKNTEPTKERLIDEHQDATHSIDEWKFLVWEIIQNFVAPPWINDGSDESEGMFHHDLLLI